jgi:uncharacterized protein
MQTDWIWGLAGGLIIGCAASLYLIVNGRIMGASGILGGLLDGSGRTSWAERVCFIAGLVAVPAIAAPLIGHDETYLTSNVAVLVISGLLVGIGTRIANGCTSGHGVCGIARLSFRGMVATSFYLLGGAAVVLVFHHLLGII